MGIKEISLDNIPDIDHLVTNLEFRPGQVLFYEGHLPYGLFILLDGEVIVDLSQRKKKIKPKHLLGVDAFLNNSSYSFTAKAATKCKVSFLSKQAFKEDLHNYEDIYSWLSN